jgi:hypothetical protein
MSKLRHDLNRDTHALAPHRPADRRAQSVNDIPHAGRLRKYDVAALRPDLSIMTGSHRAPATALFEDACSAFARGTLIPTVRGPVAIEDLLPGDYVETAHGSEAVTWIGATTYAPHSQADGETTLTGLTRITADAFGLGHPTMDLLLGPGARLVVRNARLHGLIGKDSVLAPVSDYVDGDRFLSVRPAGPVQLYHVMLRNHTTFRIGGIEVESYHPGKAIMQLTGPNRRALFLSLFPNLGQLEDFGQVTMTRTTRDVVESLIDS